ncbi:MAG: MBOAT family protein [Candidatus Saccharibacteria bacterium]|nr:MBOAT family protein [Candidatus Saccharibacteria bacterium]
MLFSSLTFLTTFLPLVLFLYYIADKKFRNAILCLASLLFYAWGEPKFIILMLISIVANYFFALWISKAKKRSKKPLLILSIIFNIALLGFFKYFNFGISIFENVTGKQLNLPLIELPIGISFYTFQILSYVVDVYRGKVKVQKNIVTLATYIALFPQLIAGPIVQYSDVEKQLKDRKESLDLFIEGVKRFVLGLAKKVIIANNVAYIADTLYAQPITEVSTIGLWLAAIAYTLQIYFDFSGYSDMAIGLGKMFGFNFLENFNYPYIATSIKDFWRRWHISLSKWFRDYIYIPLGGNRVSKLKWVRNIMIVWMLTGLWHGANWNFILWGLFYGVLLLLEGTILAKPLSKLPTWIRYILTMFIVVIGWTIFRVEHLSTLAATLGKMFGVGASFSLSEVFYSNYTLITSLPYILIGILFVTPYLRKAFCKLEQKCIWLIPVKYLVYLGMFGLTIVFLISSSYNPFIYFRF